MMQLIENKQSRPVLIDYFWPLLPAPHNSAAFHFECAKPNLVRLPAPSAPLCRPLTAPLYDTLPPGEMNLGKSRMSNFKRWGIAIAAVAMIVYVATGMRYVSYAPQRSNTYLWGVYHVHSTMSDGLQSPEEIAQQARSTGVSLVLLTDHGRPNLASSDFRKIIHGVTIVGGSEA